MGVGERAAHLALVAAASELVREADELEGVLEAAHGEGLELGSGQDDEGRRSGDQLASFSSSLWFLGWLAS